MKLYLTKLIKIDHLDRIFSFTGPSILAKNDIHALLALSHHNLSDYTLVTYIYAETNNTSKIVEWDSLLYPSELQRN